MIQTRRTPRPARFDGCTGKKKFVNRKWAERCVGYMVRNRRIKKGEMHSYLCPHCGKWHIGHPPRSKRRNQP